ncbi:MAG: hypothetical protein ACRD0P_34005 [Stackebrandtia sp.]
MDNHALRATVSAVAAHLPGFTPDSDHPDMPWLIGSEGECLIFSTTPAGSARPRLKIYAALPPDYVRGYLAGRHEITAAATRQPAAIAADITRRLLPDYRAELATAHEWLARDAAALRRRHDRVATIAARFRSSWVRDWSDHATTIHIDRGESLGPVELKLDNSGNTRITIERADPGLTDRITDVLTDHLAGTA